MQNTWLVAAAAILALGMAGTAQAAGDAAAGEAKAKGCVGCHGADGKGKGKNPPIAGKDEAAFVAVMGEYKSGAKKHSMMNMLAKKLSDQDMADLAVYYASMK
jgi:cytochrome c553